MALQIDIRPQVEVLRMFAAMKYTQWFALGEFIDNAITSAQQNAARLQKSNPGYNLEIDVRLDEGAGVLEIVDNAAGIAGRDLPRALRTAAPPSDKRFLSIYGVGMKAAGLWWAETLTIETSALGEPTSRSVTIDTRKLDRPSSGSVTVIERAAGRAQHGTVIRLSNLAKKMPEGRTLGKCRAYLASMYRNFLMDGVVIKLKGEDLVFEYPAFLDTPFWPSTAGPEQNAPSKEWVKDLAVKLPSGRTVGGWVGLLAKGSTAGAGFLLTFHGKAIVGVGAGTAEGEEFYRPRPIFGGSNSYRRQRLVGEFDVSDFGKSITSDSVNWEPEEEDEFLTGLRRQLTYKRMNFLEMAENYRAKADTGPNQVRSTQEATDDTVEAVEATIQQRQLLVALPQPESDTDQAVVSAAQETQTTIPVPGRPDGVPVQLSVERAGNADWLRLHPDDDRLIVRVNQDHPFMLSFAQLPRQELEPVLRIAVALGVAEYIDPDHVRARMNALLRGPLSSRTASGHLDD